MSAYYPHQKALELHRIKMEDTFVRCVMEKLLNFASGLLVSHLLKCLLKICKLLKIIVAL